MKKRFNIWRISVIALLAVLIAGSIAAYTGVIRLPGSKTRQNSIMVLTPYKFGAAWVFDDPSEGLKREAFVGGTPELIDAMVREIPDASSGFNLFFSAAPFPGHTHKLTWRRGDQAGNWYFSEQFGKECWLCPSLFKYFRDAPKELYVKAEMK